MQARLLSLRVLCALAAAVSAVQAQSFTEGFEPGPVTPGVAPIPAGWTSVNASPGGPGTNPNWQVRNDGAVFPAAPGGVTYAFANFNSSTGSNNISNFLISPLLSLNNGDTISFWTRTVGAPTFPDRLELVYNTTGSTLPADFTNVLVTVNPALTTAGYPTTWTQFTATITGLGGPTGGRFAFHYNPTNGGPLGANSDYIGVDDVVYTASGGGTPATNTTLGVGCGAKFNSFYELFANATTASAALTGTTVFLTPTATGYQGVVAPGTAAALFVTPVAPTTLATGDDGVVAYSPVAAALPTPYGPQSTLQISGNGIIGFGAGILDYPGTLSYTPTSNGFLNSVIGGIYAWHDYNVTESGSGLITAEEIGGVLYITFSGVENYPTGVVNPSTLQFQLELTGASAGNVRICFVNIDSNATSPFGSGHLIGVTGPGASGNPGSITLSSATAAQLLTTTEQGPLTLTASNRPIQLLAGPNNWNLVTSNVPAAGIGLDAFGTIDPNLNLNLLSLGQVGCFLRSDAPILAGPWFAAGVDHNYSLTIPGGAPALVGATITTQSIILPFTLNLAENIVSNGILGTIGDV